MIPHFFGPVTTSRERFILYNARPYFEVEPETGLPALIFPDPPDFNDGEGVRIGDMNEGMQYRLVMEDDIGLVYQWRDGISFSDDLEPVEGYFWSHFDWLYFDSPLELHGTIDGIATIGCSQDIRLIDNVLYASAEPDYGDFDEDCDDMLGIISAQDILIANTPANGRGNGYNEDRDNIDRHSIVINGALAAFGESFTFEDQNDEWELYQGPSPDDRGIIYLTGAIAQYRRHFTRRSNHQGTGYKKKYRYDTRFSAQAPPQFPTVARIEIYGEGDLLELTGEHSPYLVSDQGEGYNTITATAGTEIILSDDLALFCNDELRLLGELNNPIIFRRSGPDPFPNHPGFRIQGCDTVIIQHVVLEDDISMPLDIRLSNGLLESCSFSSGLSIWRCNNLEIRDCTFQDSISDYYDGGTGSHGNISFYECVINGLINIGGRCNSIEFVNCEISGDVTIQGDSNIILISDSNIGGFVDIWSLNSNLLIEESEMSGEEFRAVGFDEVDITDSEIQAVATFINGQSVIISECSLNELVEFQNVSDINVDNNVFDSGLWVFSTRSCSVERNIIRGGIRYRGHELIINNNTILGAETAGILIHEVNRFDINNNILYNNQVGFQINSGCYDFWSGYNCFFQNSGGDFVGLGPGWFDFNADPMFVDPEAGDYNLRQGSPCIDSGNPTFDRDPDGSQVDIGALTYDYSMSVDNEQIEVNDFSISASPNPFNSRTNIRFVSEIAGRTSIDIYDLNGRKVNSLLYEVSKGINSIPFSGYELGGTGMFFVKIRCGNHSRIVKLIYLP